jgi:hypothetical protein
VPAALATARRVCEVRPALHCELKERQNVTGWPALPCEPGPGGVPPAARARAGAGP